MLSEKSLERDLKGAQRIEEGLAKAIKSRKERGIERNLIFREAIFYLNSPIIMELQTFQRSGKLGIIKEIRSEYSRDLSKFTNANGGGSIYNMGVYPVSLVQFGTRCGLWR